MDNDNAEVKQALVSIAQRLVQMAEDRGISVIDAVRVYNAYGADGASRLAEHEALAERVKTLEELLHEIVSRGSPWIDLAYCAYCDRYDDHEPWCIWLQAIEISKY